MAVDEHTARGDRGVDGAQNPHHEIHAGRPHVGPTKVMVGYPSLQARLFRKGDKVGGGGGYSRGVVWGDLAVVCLHINATPPQR